MHRTALILIVCSILSLSAAENERVKVASLPEAVKATVSKEAPDATQAMKGVARDGKVVYRVKTTDDDGKPVMLVVGEDGAVISKKAPKTK